MTWQPIKTAPKDNTVIRLYAQGGGFYDEDFNPSGSVEGFWCDGSWSGLFWDNQHDTWFRREGIVPTHWQPLPEPLEGDPGASMQAEAPAEQHPMPRHAITLTVQHNADNEVIEPEITFAPQFGAIFDGLPEGTMVRLYHFASMQAEAPRATKDAEKRLFKFLDAAGGEGLVLDGVDAGDLFFEMFPDWEARKGEAP